MANRKMNYAEALRRANELWGRHADVEVRRKDAPELKYVVGTKGAMPEHQRYGIGPSFEDAFAAAGADAVRP